MANLNDQDTLTETVASGNSTSNLEISTGGNGETLTAYVDDAAGAAPGDFTIVFERYSNQEDRWMEHSRTSTSGATEPESIMSDAVPTKMRVYVINDTAGSVDYRLSLVSY